MKLGYPTYPVTPASRAKSSPPIRSANAKPSPTAKPFVTQAQRIEQLTRDCDAMYGVGTFKRVIDQERAKSPNGITMKHKIRIGEGLLSGKSVFLPTNLRPNPPVEKTAPAAIATSPARAIATVSQIATPASVGPTAPTMSTPKYLALTPFERGKFQAAGGKVIAPTMTRAAFTELPPAKQLQFVQGGGRLT